MATRIVSRVLRQFQVELSPRILFQSTTIAAMAEAITQEQAGLGEDEELEQVLAELEKLSEEEVMELLSGAGD